MKPWLDVPTLQAAGRILAGGYGAASFLFFVSASAATIDRAVVQNALSDTEQRRLVAFLVVGVGVAASCGLWAARRGRDALAAASRDAFLAAPLAFLMLYEGVRLEHVRLVSAGGIAALAGYALLGFARGSPRGALLDRLDGEGVRRTSGVLVAAVGIAHGLAMAWIATHVQTFGPTARAVIAMQNVALGIAALPLYGITLRLTRQAGVSLLVAVSFLLHPCVPGVGEDLRPVPFALVTFGLAWAALAIDTKAVARARRPLLLALACLGAPVLVSQSIDPRWANPLSVVVETVVTPGKWRFVAILLLPVAFLPLVRARTALLIAPGVVACLLGASPDHWWIERPHAAPILPFVYLSTVIAIASFREARTRTVLAIVCLLLTVLVSAKFAREPLLNGPVVTRALRAHAASTQGKP